MTSFRNEIFDYVKKKYSVEPEYLWARYPSYAVLRNRDCGKWFAIIMDISAEKLGLDGDERVDSINLKLGDPLYIDSLVREEGFFKGYHMSKGTWITVLLDGTVPLDEILRLVDVSYSVIASKGKTRDRAPKEWLIPANPKYYDVIHAFDETDVINWKQGKGIIKGDTVYMYVAAPVSAILFKCTVLETNIPCSIRRENYKLDELMKIKLKKRFKPKQFTFERLKDEFGIFAVRGPRGIPHSLSEALKKSRGEGR